MQDGTAGRRGVRENRRHNRCVVAVCGQVDEKGPWDASAGGHVMVRGGAVAAWLVPSNVTEDAGFRIVGAHTDSLGGGTGQRWGGGLRKVLTSHP